MQSTEPNGERILFGARRPPPLRPDAATDLPRYRAWQAASDESRLHGLLSRDRRDPTPEGPSICVVLVVERLGAPRLESSLNALGRQGPRHWPTIIVTPQVTRKLVDHLVAGSGTAAAFRRGEVLPHEGSPKVVDLGEDVEPTPATLVAKGIAEAVSEAVLPLDAGDRLAPGALELLARALREADVAYADEDEVDAAEHLGPVLKPGWSPELLLAAPYMGRPVAFRRDVLFAAGGVNEVSEGDWWHDLLLRVTERSARVAHVPEVLCHRPVGARSQAGFGPQLGDAAVTSALERRGETARVTPGPLSGTWAIRRRVDPLTVVSAIVPFRDGAPYLRACVDSLRATTSDVDLDLLLVDNGSVEPETAALLEVLSASTTFRLRHDARPFNWAAINNAAVDECRGDVLLFLNSDIEATRPGWLSILAGQALRREVGAAGARLVYPNGLLQHAGSVLGLTGAAGHVLNGLPAGLPGFQGMAVLTRDCMAVTGACLAVRRAVFEELGRFDESFARDLNDIDFCLRARAAGYRVVYEAQVELVHHESPSRGTSASVPDQLRFLDRWRSQIERGDPYLNPNVTREDPSCALKGPDEDRWWHQWLATLGP